MKNEKALLQQIAKQNNLPQLPPIPLQLIGACNKDPENIHEIADILAKNPTLSSKVLNLLNSSFYDLPHTIANIYQAVALIGAHPIKNLAICASISEACNQTSGGSIFDHGLFWQHSVKCAILAQLLVKQTDRLSLDEAFLAGLLHDIGKLVLWATYPAQYENLLASCRDQHDSVLAGESRLGATHCELGSWLLHRWNLKSFVADSVLYHHEPKNRILNALPLVQIVYTANALSKETAMAQAVGFEIASYSFGLTRPQCEKLQSRSAKALHSVAHALGIDIVLQPGLGSRFSERPIKNEAERFKKVPDLSLLLEILHKLFAARNQDDMLEVLTQGLEALFDVKNPVFFLIEPEQGVLVEAPESQNTTLSALRNVIIPLKMEESMFIASLQNKMPLDSFTWSDHQAPIILDEQIIRSTGKEGVLCVPMLVQREDIGVMLVGLDEVELPYLANQIPCLTLFANQAAALMHLDTLRRNRSHSMSCAGHVTDTASVVRKVLHEVNNPLGIIKNYLKILDVKLATQDMAQDEIRIINEEIDRAALMLNDLAGFSELTDLRTETVDINSLLSDIFKITRESLFRDEKIELHTDLDPSPLTVIAEKNALKQVFINLIKNAIEAMARGGNLFVQTRNVPCAAGHHTSDQGSESEGFAEITIKDEGMGIPDQIRSRIFEPLVTSKGRGHTGLGLSIVYNIIKALNGIITRESNKDGGTAFKIELPIATENMD